MAATPTSSAAEQTDKESPLQDQSSNAEDFSGFIETNDPSQAGRTAAAPVLPPQGGAPPVLTSRDAPQEICDSLPPSSTAAPAGGAPPLEPAVDQTVAPCDTQRSFLADSAGGSVVTASSLSFTGDARIRQNNSDGGSCKSSDGSLSTTPNALHVPMAAEDRSLLEKVPSLLGFPCSLHLQNSANVFAQIKGVKGSEMFSRTRTSSALTSEGVPLGGFWLLQTMEELTSSQREANPSHASNGNEQTVVSMVSVALGSTVPGGLPPEASHGSAGEASPPNDSFASLERQRAMAARHAVRLINLEEQNSVASFMSLSSMGVTQNGTQCSQEVCHMLFPVPTDATPATTGTAAPAVAATPVLPVCDTLPAQPGLHSWRASCAGPQRSRSDSTRAPTPSKGGCNAQRNGEAASLMALPTVPVELYAEVQLDEFQLRVHVEQAEAKAREKLRAKEVSFYLWHCRCQRRDDKATHRTTYTIPSLEREERALFVGHAERRAAKLSQQHTREMQGIAREVPSQKPTVLSRLSCENTAAFFTSAYSAQLKDAEAPPQQTTLSLSAGKKADAKRAATAAALSDAYLDAEVLRQVEVKRHLGRVNQTGLEFFGDMNL